MTSSRISMDRRALIRSGALASIAAATGLSAAASLRLGGTVRIAVPGPAASPWMPSDGFGRLLMSGTVFEPPLTLGPEGQLRPALAQSWSPSADGATWTLRLRDDARFHDGTPVNADDVAASIQRAGLAGLRRAYASGGQDVRVELREPDAALPLVLADPRFAVRPAGELSADPGTGPFRISDVRPGERIYLERVAPSGWFDAIEILRIASPDERAEALLSGRVDIADDLPEGAVEEVRRSRYAVIEQTSETRAICLLANDPVARELVSQFAEGRSVDSDIGAVKLTLSPGAGERSGMDQAVRDLAQWLRANRIDASPDRGDAEIAISCPAFDAVPENAVAVQLRPTLIGRNARLGHQIPADLTRIAETWFFT